MKILPPPTSPRRLFSFPFLRPEVALPLPLFYSVLQILLAKSFPSPTFLSSSKISSLLFGGAISPSVNYDKENDASDKIAIVTPQKNLEDFQNFLIY